MQIIELNVPNKHMSSMECTSSHLFLCVRIYTYSFRNFKSHQHPASDFIKHLDSMSKRTLQNTTSDRCDALNEREHLCSSLICDSYKRENCIENS
jgi:hypothetical protein